MTYSVQDAREHLEEILETVQPGETVVISEGGREIAEVRPAQREATSGKPGTEEAIRELQEEGVLRGPFVRPQGELTPIAVKPGALARFLASRD
ncbi:MAG TPA: type II toxin-antitoxin system prevent-host-death family antitoxin [Thermoanaerobaculia bacterium]|nr:type II toxin-antitoxin system prevent-host-death family antitoxin [Thermoanaerobaculia bacterium]